MDVEVPGEVAAAGAADDDDGTPAHDVLRGWFADIDVAVGQLRRRRQKGMAIRKNTV